MYTILFIIGEQNHFSISFKSFLEKASYQVIHVPLDMNAINKVKDNLNAILINIDEQLLEQVSELHFLKDMSLTYGIPIFAVGYKEDLHALGDVISKEIIRLEIMRPIKVHMSELVNQIDQFMKQYFANIKKKILVVDDSGSMLRSVKSWLEEKYEVFLANSGAMAIKFLVVNRPDLILLDYEMPVVDGKQVLEMIRTESDFSDIPVMFLTHKGDKESIMNVQDLKPEGYLLKTTNPSLIVKAVDDYFEGQKALI